MDFVGRYKKLENELGTSLLNIFNMYHLNSISLSDLNGSKPLIVKVYLDEFKNQISACDIIEIIMDNGKILLVDSLRKSYRLDQIVLFSKCEVANLLSKYRR